MSVLLVQTSPAAGTSVDDFNAWYDDVHLPEILASVSGILGVQRYRLVGDGPPRFLAVYSLDRPAAEVLAVLGAGVRTPGPLDLTDNPPLVQGFDSLVAP
ncbi:hypothetical protein GIS00_14590 [Nakamurella sp. YIM 132087]|uniref:DUF4286 family protein n=1 Tax=Nakamurella alba TaxID=2665158 RepID=A0A7K1FM25_9ACTN|nr:hypothetical protein [Nakamurella alba]MTD15168.1 hypothetical protein [Nakamurella alba]